MLPVLFSIGPIPISSFGFFLSLGFIYGSFLVWRLSRAWELNVEKILDMIILTFFGGLIGARIFFVALNFNFFSDDLLKSVLLTKYPGINFWGGLLGGWLTLFIFSNRFKFNFFQIADLAAIGVLGGIVFGDIGCFLGGCSIGKISNFFFATSMVGALGKRFPVQILEAILVGTLLFKLWPIASHFHISGAVLSKVLIFLGFIKLFTEFFRDINQGGYFLSLVMVGLGIFIHYQISKSSIKKDMFKFFWFINGLFTNSNTWKLMFERIKKSWYNFIITWNLRFKSTGRFLRRARVKPTPKNF